MKHGAIALLVFIPGALGALAQERKEEKSKPIVADPAEWLRFGNLPMEKAKDFYAKYHNKTVEIIGIKFPAPKTGLILFEYSESTDKTDKLMGKAKVQLFDYEKAEGVYLYLYFTGGSPELARVKSDKYISVQGVPGKMGSIMSWWDCKLIKIHDAKVK
jgi:hypothetical protein